jgi:hypothetical protein
VVPLSSVRVEPVRLHSGRLVRKLASHSSWAWRGGSHPISVVARSLTIMRPPAERAGPPIELQPAWAPRRCPSSMKFNVIRVPATSGRGRPSSVTSVDRNVRPQGSPSVAPVLPAWEA